MKIITRIAGVGIVLVLLILATKQYLGYRYFYRYKSERASAKSIEKSFPELERDLKKSISFSKNPLFYAQMSQIYQEMAIVENKFGTEEKRDFYIDQARESLLELIKTNPIDAFAYYEMGKVYMLYNFPLLTYMDKAKRYFLKALELKPADEFLNLNIVYIYLTQWDFLNTAEKSFVFKRLEKMWKNNENFITQLQNQWEKGFPDDEKLKEILSEDKDFWEEIKKYFDSGSESTF